MPAFPRLPEVRHRGLRFVVFVPYVAMLPVLRGCEEGKGLATKGTEDTKGSEGPEVRG